MGGGGLEEALASEVSRPHRGIDRFLRRGLLVDEATGVLWALSILLKVVHNSRYPLLRGGFPHYHLFDELVLDARIPIGVLLNAPTIGSPRSLRGHVHIPKSEMSVLQMSSVCLRG